jgi:hypothetical protein
MQRSMSSWGLQGVPGLDAGPGTVAARMEGARNARNVERKMKRMIRSLERLSWMQWWYDILGFASFCADLSTV